MAPPHVFPGRIVSCEISCVGGRYRAANGTRIPNVGQQEVQFLTDESYKDPPIDQVFPAISPPLPASDLPPAPEVPARDHTFRSVYIRHSDWEAWGYTTNYPGAPR